MARSPRLPQSGLGVWLRKIGPSGPHMSQRGLLTLRLDQIPTRCLRNFWMLSSIPNPAKIIPHVLGSGITAKSLL